MSTTLSKEQSEFLNTLEEISNVLIKTQTNLKKCPKARLTEGYIKTRIQSIEDYWKTFSANHQMLTKCTPREQRGLMNYFLKEDFYTCEELYHVLKADLLDLLTKTQQSVAMDTTEPHTEKSGLLVKLPRIQLPNFSGKYEEFPTYKDLFISLVHGNKTLSCVQKLHYLKTSLLGEAEALLKHIPVTENNYSQAWETLNNRYGNKRLITTSLLKRLFYQRKVNNQSAQLIKSLVDTTTECLNSLKNLEIAIEQWDPLIVFLVVQKLDILTHKEWEECAYNKNADDLPKWKQLKEFLEAKFRTLEMVTPITTRSAGERPQRTFHVIENKERPHTTTTSMSKTNMVCAYCNDSHYIYNCKEFSKQTVEDRSNFVKKNNLCFNCLVPNHSVYRCKQKTSCRICKRKHHSLLHNDRPQTRGDDTATDTQISNETTEKETSVKTYYSREKQSKGQEVLLATALVGVTSNRGSHTCRALIDQGSEASFVTTRIADLLALKKTKIRAKVSGVGEEKLHINYKTTLSLQTESKGVIQVDAYVMKNISSQLPALEIKVDLPEMKTLTLADPTYGTPGKIDILLGAAVYAKILEEGLVRLSDNLVAQKTVLGWILSGQAKHTPSKSIQIRSLFATVKEDNDLLRKFWEIETSSYTKRKILTQEEEKCEMIYKSTTKREEGGRYVVQLPLKQTIEETLQRVGRTKEQSIVRLKQLERKFQRNDKLRKEYTKVIREYLQMGHMKKADTEEENKLIYLPHHAVVREDKDTTKVRVVYDASAKGTGGYSLNDTMMVGPVLQPDLRSLITCWRKQRICVVGDIVKMYRNINMLEEHTNLQCIVWRDDPEKEIETYKLLTVTFGTAAAPYLAVRTLTQLADDEMNEFPDAAAAIKQSFYMDDLMLNHDDVAGMKILCHDIKTVLKKGGFKMQKWSSNSEEVLSFLKEEKDEVKDKLDIKLDNIIKILGLSWNRKRDTFKVTVNLPELNNPVTKRTVLSDVARLFDPFGWLAPVVITAKVMIQRLWLCKLTWDDELPDDMKEEWISYRNELTNLQTIEVPRWLHISPTCKEIQIHGFSDASITSYAAVTYLRVLDGDGMVHVTILASRTKVAPLKQLTIPRLELCGAALLAELIQDMRELLKVPNNKIFAYTDSLVVLSWLQSQPNRWQTFVGNKVADILRVLDNSQWRHIQSADNPADIATRGLNAKDLRELDAWWSGPACLKNKDIELQEYYDIPQTEIEMKKCFQTHTHEEEKPIWERFSSLTRMKRVLAYCLRLNKRNRQQETYITTDELEDVLQRCIKYYQNKIFGNDIDKLQKDGWVRKGSPLITLFPFLDKNGVLKVGGRLKNAALPDDFKHPIIIPKEEHITQLIIREAHIKTLHGGIQAMVSYIRSKYWVLGLKASVKKYIRSCKTCIIDKAKVKEQLMGHLPAVRVNPHRAFVNSGVDYAGPIQVRMSKGRGYHATKGYICLFICMATRAIHLEVVTDLTAQAFIAAFRRFVSRRGQCTHLWSDNGTNFVGAAKELRELFQKSSNGNIAQEVAELLANDGTKWHFIPPRMPNYGGLWEAGVRSVKRHLTRVIGSATLTYEEMATLLAQVEACLNSRPICQLDDTIDTLNPLTPGHFLVGEPLINVPDDNYEEKSVHLLTRWQNIQRMVQQFWRRWQAEYLNTIQQRYKWQVPIQAIKVNDIVVIKDTELPPSKWLLGKVKAIHPGSDNLIRVVTVQCKGNNELKRPVSKLIILPCEPQE